MITDVAIRRAYERVRAYTLPPPPPTHSRMPPTREANTMVEGVRENTIHTRARETPHVQASDGCMERHGRGGNPQIPLDDFLTIEGLISQAPRNVLMERILEGATNHPPSGTTTYAPTRNVPLDAPLGSIGQINTALPRHTLLGCECPVLCRQHGLCMHNAKARCNNGEIISGCDQCLTVKQEVCICLAIDRCNRHDHCLCTRKGLARIASTPKCLKCRGIQEKARAME